jgi:hypothetical protein
LNPWILLEISGMQRIWVCHTRWNTLQLYLWSIKEKRRLTLALRMSSHW